MRILSLSTLFGDGFFENDGAISMLTESMTLGLESVSLSQLSIVIKHGLTNVVALCQPKFYPKLVPLLERFLGVVFKKLDASFTAMRRREDGGAADPDPGPNVNVDGGAQKKENSAFLRFVF